MKTILYLTSWYGVYTAFMQIWQWAEKLELGYTIVTKVDSAICLVISLIVAMVIVVYSEN